VKVNPPKTQVLNASDDLQPIVPVLQQGGIIAYPTEAVFGLSCDPFNPQAVNKLCQLKQRAPEKSFILLINDYQQFDYCSQPLAEPILHNIRASWPGPITWVVPASKHIPAILCGPQHTIALRMSAFPLIQKILHVWGKPMISTSANLAGCAPAKTTQEILATFDQKIDLLINGETGKRNKPSEIRDALTGKTLRAG
jgi:L-threonylcarbamoyladenylate synthase